MNTQNLLVELFVEELPPKALQTLGNAFSNLLFIQLQEQGLSTAASQITTYATPRRLAVHITQVVAQAADKEVSARLMPVKVGLDEQGQATPALLKRLNGMGLDEAVVAKLKRVDDGKAEMLFYDSIASGATLAAGLQQALGTAIAKLPIPKVMGYQLEDGWTTVSFVRPVHAIVALHGADVIPVKALGLEAGRFTHGHRFEAKADPLEIRDADSYAQQLKEEGAVIASFTERKAMIQEQLKVAAAKIGGDLHPINDEALLDEVTALVERPNVLACKFEREFLEVPQECLILTMKANQKYFPLMNAQERLSSQFLVVSNIRPKDPSAVIGGNERVVRPRLADAKFFYDQDRKQTLLSRTDGYKSMVYHNQLGTLASRVERIRAIAVAIAEKLGADWGGAELKAQAGQSALLAKADLLTAMVGEFPELQGIMGHYYALNDGLPADVATAIEDHYKPRFAGDELPRNKTGLVAALADKLETLVGMFGIGNTPTGDKDPFALRRHALGVIRILTEKNLPLQLDWLLQTASRVFGSCADFKDPTKAVADFVYDRFAGVLHDQGYNTKEIDAVLALHPQRFDDVVKRLEAVRTFAALPEAPALAAANKRVGNILKKSDETIKPLVEQALLKEAAEVALEAALRKAEAVSNPAYEAGDYIQSLKELAALKEPVDAFFDQVMVNAEEAGLRRNRLGLLALMYQVMNRVADLACLA